MDSSAFAALERLLRAGEKHDAGVRSRPAALTTGTLAEYRNGRSLSAKEEFEATMRAARAHQAITLEWDDRLAEDGFIKRVELLDAGKLAEFLGRALHTDVHAEARRVLLEAQARHVVLREVLARWGRLQLVRNTGPDKAAYWADAVKVVDFAASLGQADAPLRVASARLFNDSKRIERLAAPIDVLLSGDISAPPREAGDVFRELGLVREEQPALLAGAVAIRRKRASGILDIPYSGLPTWSVEALETTPERVLSIENLTTFHAEAKRLCERPELVLYTAGMPTPAWRAMYRRLLANVPATVPVLHWGDIDEGGMRIASVLASDARLAGHELKPWLMDPLLAPAGARVAAAAGTLARMARFAERAGWYGLAQAVQEAGVTVEQESLQWGEPTFPRP